MKLSPSLFAADPLEMLAAVAAVEPHVGSWHFDVMDGRFAGAHGLNEMLFSALRKASPRPIDVHLMIETPGDWPLRFAQMGARLVAVHGETVDDPSGLLTTLRQGGALAYLAYTPDTPPSRIRSQAAADGVLLLTAPQGGGAFRPDALARLSQLPRDLPKIVDGGIGPEHFDFCRDHGVQSVVVGRSLFGEPDLAHRAAELSDLVADDVPLAVHDGGRQ